LIGTDPVPGEPENSLLTHPGIEGENADVVKVIWKGIQEAIVLITLYKGYNGYLAYSAA
jgi:hypothetical protein